MKNILNEALIEFEANLSGNNIITKNLVKDNLTNMYGRLTKIEWEPKNIDNLIKFDINQPYTKVNLIFQPVELAILRFEPCYFTAIHDHPGYWGYVIIISGEGIDKAFNFDGKTLIGRKETHLKKGDLVFEIENGIHLFKNSSKNTPLVSLHCYYPPHSLDNSRIFDIEQKRIGIMNEKSRHLSWSLSDQYFHKIIENAFEYEA